MSAKDEKTIYVQSLQRMLDRLGASDLTLAESIELQPRLFELLGEIEAAEQANCLRNLERSGRALEGSKESRRGGCAVGC